MSLNSHVLSNGYRELYQRIVVERHYLKNQRHRKLDLVTDLLEDFRIFFDPVAQSFLSSSTEQ